MSFQYPYRLVSSGWPLCRQGRSPARPVLEAGLIRRRLLVEIEWLALAAEPHFAEIPAFSGDRCGA